MNRGVKRLLLALVGAIAIAGASILWVETSCIARSFNPAPPRLADDTRHQPAASVWPVFMPSTLRSMVSRRLRLPCLIPL